MKMLDFVAMLCRLEVERVELEYRIHDTQLPALRLELQAAGIAVVSVHNFFPFPTRFQQHLAPDGDLFRLSATDSDERALAVRWTTRTIEVAHELEAGRVVLHCGRVDMVPEIDALHGLFKEGGINGPEGQALRGRLTETRESCKGPHLDALKFSIEALLGPAERLGVRLGLENRYQYHELPGPEEFHALFQLFDGAPLGYWHDVGHANAAEILGFSEPGELLRRYGHRLVGVHIHDANGLDDHLPPGSGDMDFSTLGSLPQDIPLVMELKPNTAEKDISAGLEHLREVFRENSGG